VRAAIEGVPGLSMTLLSSSDVCQGQLAGFDVLVVPGGQASVQGSALGVEGRDAVRSFVSSGKGYVGFCAGAYLAATNQDWSLKLVNVRTLAGSQYVPGYGDVSASFRGWGDVSVELTAHGRHLLEGLPARFSLGYTGGPVFLRANEPTLPDYEPLAYFRTEVWKYPFQKGAMVNTPAILAARFGRGKVILFSPHPETSPGFERLLTDGIRACAAPDHQPAQPASK